MPRPKDFFEQLVEPNTCMECTSKLEERDGKGKVWFSKVGANRFKFLKEYFTNVCQI